MAGYGYANRSYSTYNDLAPKTDNWSKTSYATDHLCKPVIVDADGRKHPIVYFNPSSTETHVIETETIVKQHVLSPFVNDYKHNSHTKFEPLNDYGHVEDQWRRSSSPVHGHVNDYKHNSHMKVEPLKDYGHDEDHWRRSSSPVHGHVNDYKHNSHMKVEPLKDYGHDEDQWRRSSSPVHDHGRPQKVDEFLTKVQTEASKPKTFGLLGPSVWYRRPNSTGHPGQEYGHGNTGYGDYKPSGHTIQNGDYDKYSHNNPKRMEPSRAGWAAPPDTALSSPTNDMGTAVEYLKETARPTPVAASPHSQLSVPIKGQGYGHGNTGYGDYKPSGHTFQNGDYDKYIHNNPNRMEPTMTSSDGRARPIRAGWATPPETTLSRPTNDIGAAVGYLKEAVRPTSVTSFPHSRVSVPITTGPKRDHEYVETIDSREAARRYGNFNSSSMPEQSYTGTIDSRTAAKKYSGTTV